MRKLQNNILQRFLDEFVKELKEYNRSTNTHTSKPLDIPFIISSMYQDFQNNTSKYDAFITDLYIYPDYTFILYDGHNDYDGIIDVEINLMRYVQRNDCNYYECEHPNFNYKMKFTYDTRNYGYCECTPDMPDYREDKHCCGHGCDAVFCEFSLHKVLKILSYSWDGDEHDYWEFEDEFYLNDKEFADKKRKKDKEMEIAELKNRIEADQKRLAELEGGD